MTQPLTLTLPSTALTHMTTYRTACGMEIEMGPHVWVKPDTLFLTDDVEEYLSSLPAHHYSIEEVSIVACSEINYAINGQQSIRSYDHNLLFRCVEFSDDKALVEAHLRFS